MEVIVVVIVSSRSSSCRLPAGEAVVLQISFCGCERKKKLNRDYCSLAFQRDRGRREEGQGTRDKGQGTRDKGQGTRDKGQGTSDEGQGMRDEG